MSDSQVVYRHETSRKSRQKVYEWAKAGLGRRDVAAKLARFRQQPVTEHTITQFYKEEYAQGRADMLEPVASSLLERAVGNDVLPPDVNAQRFILERRGGEEWQPEPSRLEVGRPGEFAAMSDAELAAELASTEDRLASLGVLPASDGPVLEGTWEEQPSPVKKSS